MSLSIGANSGVVSAQTSAVAEERVAKPSGAKLEQKLCGEMGRGYGSLMSRFQSIRERYAVDGKGLAEALQFLIQSGAPGDDVMAYAATDGLAGIKTLRDVARSSNPTIYDAALRMEKRLTGLADWAKKLSARSAPEAQIAAKVIDIYLRGARAAFGEVFMQEELGFNEVLGSANQFMGLLGDPDFAKKLKEEGPEAAREWAKQAGKTVPVPVADDVFARAAAVDIISGQFSGHDLRSFEEYDAQLKQMQQDADSLIAPLVTKTGAQLARKTVELVRSSLATSLGAPEPTRFQKVNREGMPTPTMVKSGTAELAVFEFGPKDGPPLIYLHGGPGSVEMPDAMKKLAAKGYRVLYFDQRGVGLSKKPTDGDYTVAATMKDIDNVLAAKGVDGKVTVYGQSFGGKLGMFWSTLNASRVKQAILASPDLSLTPQEAASARGSIVNTHSKRSGWAQALITKSYGTDLTVRSASDDSKELAKAQSVLEKYMGRVIRYYSKDPMTAKEWGSKQLGMVNVKPFTRTGGTFGAITPPDFSPEKALQGVPVRILLGDSDIWDPAFVGALARSRFGQGQKVTVIPNSGHFTATENTKAWDAAVPDAK